MATAHDVHDVTSYEECVELARARGEGIPAQGWTACIQEVLVSFLPQRIDLAGDRFRRDGCQGVDVSDEGHVLVIFGYEDRFAEIPLEELPLPSPLPPIAELWISSYVKWRTERLRLHGIE